MPDPRPLSKAVVAVQCGGLVKLTETSFLTSQIMVKFLTAEMGRALCEKATIA